MSHFGLGLISSNGVPGNDAFTKILLHMDGSNGGTTFTDVNAGGVSNTWSALSDAVTTTAAAKFGPSSLNSGAGGFGISTSAKSALDPGTGDFTVDFWYNHNGQAGGLEKGICCSATRLPNPTQWAWSIDFASDRCSTSFLTEAACSFPVPQTSILDGTTSKCRVPLAPLGASSMVFSMSPSLGPDRCLRPRDR